VEFNDVYDENRKPTGKVHRRGTPWKPGEYGLVVCVWVYDGKGRVLLTRRAKGKSFAGTWENSGGGAQAGETSLQAIKRELFEETGIQAEESEFELLYSDKDNHILYDFYCLHKQVELKDIKLQPGETDGVQWATFDQVHELISKKKICYIIAGQFLKQEPMLKLKQIAQERM
jgi:mutator protein MutT